MEKLSQNFIGILNRSFLSGTIWICKIDSTTESLSDILVIPELDTVVCGNREDVLFYKDEAS